MQGSDIEERFLDNQAKIAFALLGLLAGTITIVAVLYATKRWTNLDAGDIRDFGALVVVPIVTLVATTVSFYFGERRRR